MTDTRVHPETGKILRRDVRPQVVRYGSFTRTVQVARWYPDDDGDAIHTDGDLAESDQVFQERRSAYGEHVRRIRKDKLE